MTNASREIVLSDRWRMNWYRNYSIKVKSGIAPAPEGGEMRNPFPSACCLHNSYSCNISSQHHVKLHTLCLWFVSFLLCRIFSDEWWWRRSETNILLMYISLSHYFCFFFHGRRRTSIDSFAILAFFLGFYCLLKWNAYKRGIIKTGAHVLPCVWSNLLRHYFALAAIIGERPRNWNLKSKSM